MKNQIKIPSTTQATLNKRINRYQKKGWFCSGLTQWENPIKARENLCICSRRIWEEYFQDDIKAPYGTNAKPASLSKPSMNFYFGDDVEFDEERNTQLRKAYAVGSGLASIGIDPSTFKIHMLFREMDDLMTMAYRVVKGNQAFSDTLQVGQFFNFCSVKIYFSYQDQNGFVFNKSTDWHTDISLKNDGTPTNNNSQVPGTPVVIATFGDTKNLEFIRHDFIMDRDKRYNKLSHDEKTYLRFPQKNGSIFILHPKDETVDQCKKTIWKHRSEMIKSDNPNGQLDVIFSFMFRVVQREEWVYAKDSTLVNPPKIGPKVQQRIKTAKRTMESNHYKDEQDMLETKMARMFESYTSYRLAKKLNVGTSSN
jgi:hypothetical protein